MLDRAKSEAIRRGLNLMVRERYGEVQSLRFDTSRQTVELQILLHGEIDPIDVVIGRYEFHGEKEVSVTLHQISVSRRWMQELASDRLDGSRFKLPSKIRGLVKALFAE